MNFSKPTIKLFYDGSSYYVSVFTVLNGEYYYRYLYPSGWGLTAHYYSSENAAQKVIDVNKNSLIPPVTCEEQKEQRELSASLEAALEELYEDMMEKDKLS